MIRVRMYLLPHCLAKAFSRHRLLRDRRKTSGPPEKPPRKRKTNQHQSKQSAKTHHGVPHPPPASA